MPPLRERTDVREIINQLLAWDFPARRITIAAPALAALERFEWPGNIRQLRNVLRTAVTLTDSDNLQLDHFPADIVKVELEDPTLPASERSPLFKMERNTIMTALKEAHWNVTKAAKQLNVSRNTLYRKMKRHGISPPR